MGSVLSANTPNRIVTATPTATAAGLRKLIAVSPRKGLSNPTLADLKGPLWLLEITWT